MNADAQKATVLLQCPCTCGGAVTFFETSDKGAGVLHTVPTCETYDRLDPIEFAAHLRKAKMS